MSQTPSRPALVRGEPRILAGVCAGVALHLGLTLRAVRVLMAISVLAGGAGIVLYGWLWIFMPSVRGQGPRGCSSQHGPRRSTLAESLNRVAEGPRSVRAGCPPRDPARDGPAGIGRTGGGPSAGPRSGLGHHLAGGGHPCRCGDRLDAARRRRARGIDPPCTGPTARCGAGPAAGGRGAGGAGPGLAALGYGRLGGAALRAAGRRRAPRRAWPWCCCPGRCASGATTPPNASTGCGPPNAPTSPRTCTTRCSRPSP